MKILVFSDLQAHAYQQFAGRTERGLNTRFQDCLDIIDQARQIVLDREIDLVVFGGDLFESRTKIDVDVYTETYLAFEKLRNCRDHLPLIMVCGNHDQHVRVGDIHSLEPFRAIGCTVVASRDVLPIRCGSSALVVAAHAYTDDLESFRTWLAKVDGVDLLLIHQTITEAAAGPVDRHLANGISVSEIPQQIRLCVSGHIHKRQTIGKVHIPGSPLQLTFGEAGDEKAFTVLDTTDWSIESIPTDAPRFFKFNVQDFREAINWGPASPDRDFVKLLYDAEDAKLAERIKRDFPRVLLEETARPVVIFRASEVAADTDEQLLREFLDQADLEGLDKGELFEVGRQLLKGDGI